MRDGGTTPERPDAPPRHRILIFGPSGAGTSTLGRALATARGSQHFDADDFYWAPTDPPFRVKRPAEERCDLMRQMFLPRADWVLSGAVEGWGEAVVDRLSFAVFLTLAQAPRRQRLEARERLRHGAAMAPGGAAHEEVRAFLNWADGYEAGLRPGRSLSRHELWASGLPCPVLRLDAGPPPERLVAEVQAALAQVSAGA